MFILYLHESHIINFKKLQYNILTIWEMDDIYIEETQRILNFILSILLRNAFGHFTNSVSKLNHAVWLQVLLFFLLSPTLMQITLLYVPCLPKLLTRRLEELVSKT